MTEFFSKICRQVFNLLIAVSAFAMISCGTTKGDYYGEGVIAGELIQVNLDSEIAKYSLQNSTIEPDELRLKRLQLTQSIEGIPTADELQYLVENGSTDFASVVYLKALTSHSNNLTWQQNSYNLSNSIDSIGNKNNIRSIFEKYHALLIPGWHWKTRSDTGADLNFQRKVLASYGLQSSLIETNEHGSVEENGKIIANSIRAAKSLDKSIVLISVSKGGADTAYAVGHLLNAGQHPHLKGWLNIGGIISGSTLVDLEMDNPSKWLSSIGFAEDTPLSAVRSLQKKYSFQRESIVDYPDEITIINYVAVPFKSNLSSNAEYSYSKLARYGPNDGAALIYEMLVPEANTVVEIGLDHYMRSLKAMRRAIALLYLIMEDENP